MPEEKATKASYHVSIELRQVHHFSVQAETPDAAQAIALSRMADRPAERWDMSIEVERGVR